MAVIDIIKRLKKNLYDNEGMFQQGRLAPFRNVPRQVVGFNVPSRQQVRTNPVLNNVVKPAIGGVKQFAQNRIGNLQQFGRGVQQLEPARNVVIKDGRVEAKALINSRKAQQGLKNAFGGGAKFITNMAGLKTVTPKSVVGGASLLGGMNAAFNKIQGKSAVKGFRQGVKTGVSEAPIFGLTGAATNKVFAPVVNKASSKLGPIVGQRVASVPREIAQGYSLSQAQGRKYTPADLGYDVAQGLVFGAPDAPNAKGFGTLYRDDIKQTKEALDYLNYTDDIARGMRKGKIDFKVMGQLERDADAMRKGYNLATVKEWGLMSLKDKYKMIARKQTDLYSDNPVILGIKGKGDTGKNSINKNKKVKKIDPTGGAFSSFATSPSGVASQLTSPPKRIPGVSKSTSTIVPQPAKQSQDFQDFMDGKIKDTMTGPVQQSKVKILPQQKVKIKPKLNEADQKLAQAMMEPRALLKELGYPPKEINKLSGNQQWAITYDRIPYEQFKKEKFIRDQVIEKAARRGMPDTPPSKPAPSVINIKRGGAGDMAQGKALTDKEGFDQSFAKWIGQRDAARTTGVEIGAKYKNVPAGVKGEDVIKYIENPKGNASPELKAYARDLRKEYDALYSSAQEAGIDMKYVKDYVTHIWDKPMEEVQQMYRSMGQKFNFSKDRVLPTYEEGIKMGLKPKYNNPAQIIAEYAGRLERVKANIEFANELEKQGYIVAKRVAGFEPITVPGFMGKTTQLEDGTIREGLYYAPPEIAKQINRVFSESDSPKALKIGAKLSGGLQDITLSGGIPKTPVNAWTFAQVLKEVTAGRVGGPIKALYHSMVNSDKYFADNAQYIKEQQLNNIPISTSLNIDSLLNKNAVQKYIGKDLGDVWNKAVNEPTFKRFMPALQTEFYKDVRNAALKKGMGESDAIRVASQATRNFYGITSSADLAKRSSTVKDLSGTFLFAPRYRESMVNFWLNNLKALKNPLALENRANVTFMVGATATALIYDQLNRAFNDGRSMLDNPPGMEDKLLIPVGNGDVIGVPFLSSIATIPRAMFREGKMLLKGDITGAAKDAMQSYSSMAVKPIADVIANEDYFGQPIVEDNMTPGEKFGAQAKYLGKQYFLGHPYLKEVMDPANQGDPAYQRLSRAMEAPLRFYTEKSIQGRYYYGARDKALEGLSGDEQTAYEAIPKYDSNDPNTTMFKYQTYLAYPKVFQAKQQTELEMAEKTGKAIDPLYLVDYDTAKKYMRYETLPPGSADRKAMINAYPELEALFDVRSKYFDENPIPGGNTSKRPLPSKYVQAQMDAKNWKDPQVRAYLDANRLYQNAQREKLGLPPLDDYGWGSGSDTKKARKVQIAKASIPGKVQLKYLNLPKDEPLDVSKLIKVKKPKKLDFRRFVEAYKTI